MKYAVIGLAAMFVILLAGCDDDCPNCPSSAVPAGIVSGNIYVRPDLELRARIVPQGSFSPVIDSGQVGDSMLYYLRHYSPQPTGYNGGEVIWEIIFGGETGPNYMYAHGDTAHLAFWGNGSSAACDVVVLDPFLAAANITSPLTQTDTVAPGESITVYWNRIEHVQYYGLAIVLLDAEAEESLYDDILFDWTTDTSYTLDADLYPDSLLYIGFNVLPYTGPNPTSAGNFTGGWLSGRITSSGSMNYSQILGWVGGADVNKVASENSGVRPRLTAEEIIEGVYRRAAK